LIKVQHHESEKIEAKQVKLDESNVSGIGSKEDIALRVKAAKHEHEWENVGKDVGTVIWRVEKFNVIKFPKKQYGTFYTGDSYLILNGYKVESALKFDIFFWLGSKTSIDERCVAAYKTVELDDVLGGAPVQHREVEGTESSEFLKIFGGKVHYLDGGVESGFNHHNPDAYKPKLFQVKGKSVNGIRVAETALSGKSLNIGDVFILDAGLVVYLWEPSQANHNEKYLASTTAEGIKSNRKGCEITNLEESGDEKFWKILGGKPNNLKSAEEGGDDNKKNNEKILYQVNLKDENNPFTELEKGKTVTKKLNGDNIYIIDASPVIFVWLSDKQDIDSSLYHETVDLFLDNRVLSVRKIFQGKETEEFNNLFK